jgi:hypothetical protein
VHVKLRPPSPAMVVACLALFVALGGSGYAAIRTVQSAATHKKKSKAPSQQALINAAVAKYLSSHHSQFAGAKGETGAAGPAGVAGPTGATGAAGTPGTVGQRGEQGPSGLVSQSASLAGPLKTGSSNPVELGGPSVTVNVGPSGLVEYWATATISSTGGTAEVVLFGPSGYAPQLQNSGLPVTLYTMPGSDNGTNIFNPGPSTWQVGPGRHTFTLEYADTAGEGTFSEVELVVIPV